MNTEKQATPLAQPPATTTTVKMRVNRVSAYDSGGKVMHDVSLISTDMAGQPLNDPETVVALNMNGTFLEPSGAALQHDAVLDVTFAVTVAAPLTREGKAGNGEAAA
jgi:hypothetical protein